MATTKVAVYPLKSYHLRIAGMERDENPGTQDRRYPLFNYLGTHRLTFYITGKEMLPQEIEYG